MMRKILVPLDGSSLAERILPYAVVFATQFEAELLLLRIVEDGDNITISDASKYLENLQTALKGHWLPDNPLPYAVRLLAARVMTAMNRPELASDETPYPVSILALKGQPGSQILKTAAEQHIDLIMMNTHGRGHNPFSNLVGGNVLAKILHAATVPVLLVHHHPDNKTTLADAFRAVPPNMLKKPVVVPLDGSPLAETALNYVLKLTGKTQAQLALLEVIPTPEEVIAKAGVASAGFYPLATDPDLIKKSTLEYLSTIEAQRLPEHNYQAIHIQEGETGPEIIKYAQRNGAGIIAMASHTRTAMGQAIMGSITKYIVRNSHLPVLVVNPRLSARSHSEG
jgi:nucleotide-binding universal stress UspA family protein